VYQEQGHEFYVLILNALSTALVYDITTGLWHERASNAGGGALALPVQTNVSSLQTGTGTALIFAGGPANGNIYKQSLAFTNDNGTAILRQRTATHIHDGLRWIRYPYFEVHADIGSASMSLLYSNDGGKTFPALHRPDATLSGSNDQGGGSNFPTFPRFRWHQCGGGGSNFPTFPRFRWHQCGRARKRTFGVTILDGNNPIRIANGLVRAAGGTEQ